MTSTTARRLALAAPRRGIRYSAPAIETFDRAAVLAALDGDVETMTALVRALRPTVQAEVAWTLHRYAPRGGGRDPRQETADMVQEVFLSLLDDDGKALRAWDPARGRSLKSFVALVARHQVVSLLRSGRRCPWTEEPTPIDQMQLMPVPSPETAVGEAQAGRQLLAGLRAQLSTRSMLMFEGLYVEEKSVDEICAEFGVTRNALYAWRSRLKQRISALATALGLRGADE